MTPSAKASMSGSRPARTNVLARHWRGELPLWVSFWIVGIGLCVGGAVAVLGILLALDAIGGWLPRHGTAFVFLLTAVAHLAALVFASVGIWRAATNDDLSRRARGRRPLWGWVAKACVAILGYLYYVGPLQRIAGG